MSQETGNSKQDVHAGETRQHGPKLTRRQVLAGAAGVAAASVSKMALGQGESPVERARIPGAPADALGERSSFEQLERFAAADWPHGKLVSLSPLGDLEGTITPSDLHFEVHHHGIPEIDPATYKLLIHGMVEQPMVFTLDNLKRFPRVTRISALECSGNSLSHYLAPSEDDTAQSIAGLASCSEWVGVPVSTLFKEVGVRREATWALFEAMDGALHSRSWPTEKLWPEALLVFGQNGEALRPSQGYPVRLLVPGSEGNANVKWLRRIELSDQPWHTRMETSSYSDVRCGPDGCVVTQFTLAMDAKSIITWPSGGQTISEPGLWEIIGIAWTGRGTIDKVEVSTDNGKTWGLANLDQPVLPKAFTRFRYLWHWDGNETKIVSRATDSTGYVQPTREELIAWHGSTATFYHSNESFRWKVSSNGQITGGDVA